MVVPAVGVIAAEVAGKLLEVLLRFGPDAFALAIKLVRGNDPKDEDWDRLADLTRQKEKEKKDAAP